jgi:nucleoside-diphosphate-sugar epimerase
MTLFDGVHDFIYIDDFLRGIDLLVNAERWPSGEIVNFGSGTQYRNITVLKLWENITGRTAPVEYINRFSKPFETDFWQCDTTYAKQQYGFVTEYSLEQGIEDFIKKMEVK